MVNPPDEGLSGRERRRAVSPGMTLIEIMVAMAIVGIILAVSIVGLRSAFNVNLKSSAGKLAATLRYMSNKAVTDHMYLRMVYDLDEHSYRAEESLDPFLIAPEEDEKKADKTKEEKTAETEEGDGEESSKKAEEGGFTASESKLLQPYKLPSGVAFKDVAVSYLKGRREKGQAYTYFFPDGFSTPTVINLRNDEDDEHFSVEVMPLSGRVKVDGSYKEGLSEERKTE